MHTITYRYDPAKTPTGPGAGPVANGALVSDEFETILKRDKRIRELQEHPAIQWIAWDRGTWSPTA